MKIYLLVLLSITELFALSVEHISIENRPYSIVKESYDEYGSKGEVMRLYKGEEQKEESLLFVFTLRERNGPCSARERERGTYEINASIITFYSSWKRGGKAYDAPSGARIKVYEILSNGSLKKISSRVYIEESKRNYDEDSGMKYLFTPPKTKEEKEALEEYVSDIEKEYDGKFVFEEESRELIREVKNAFKRKVKSLWGTKR